MPSDKFNTVKCPVCGKNFIPAPLHAWKLYGTKRRVCTYTCQQQSKREHEAIRQRKREVKL